ncbi:MAG: MBL fold metallo-hydrolase [Verrucomicrobiia bacterium]
MKTSEGVLKDLIRQGAIGAVVAATLACATGPVVAAESAAAVDRIPAGDGELVVRPINHATFALEWKGKNVLVDPVGGAARFEGLPKPDLVLITHIHGDHLDPATLASVVVEKTALVAPKAVFDKLASGLRQKTSVLANGENKTVLGIKIEAVPAYNTTPERRQYHAKGPGNGYVLNLGDSRVYISGDTEDIPEMRALKDIDVAFLCMNLPYTMTVEQAASAVREFKPKIVYPYHSRGSDLEKFKQLVGTDSGVEVRLRKWYRERSSDGGEYGRPN